MTPLAQMINAIDVLIDRLWNLRQGLHALCPACVLVQEKRREGKQIQSQINGWPKGKRGIGDLLQRREEAHKACLGLMFASDHICGREERKHGAR